MLLYGNSILCLKNQSRLNIYLCHLLMFEEGKRIWRQSAFIALENPSSLLFFFLSFSYIFIFSLLHLLLLSFFLYLTKFQTCALFFSLLNFHRIGSRCVSSSKNPEYMYLKKAISHSRLW